MRRPWPLHGFSSTHAVTANLAVTFGAQVPPTTAMSKRSDGVGSILRPPASIAWCSAMSRSLAGGSLGSDATWGPHAASRARATMAKMASFEAFMRSPPRWPGVGGGSLAGEADVHLLARELPAVVAALRAVGERACEDVAALADRAERLQVVVVAPVAAQVGAEDAVRQLEDRQVEEDVLVGAVLDHRDAAHPVADAAARRVVRRVRPHPQRRLAVARHRRRAVRPHERVVRRRRLLGVAFAGAPLGDVLAVLVVEVATGAGDVETAVHAAAAREHHADVVVRLAERADVERELRAGPEHR